MKDNNRFILVALNEENNHISYFIEISNEEKKCKKKSNINCDIMKLKLKIVV